MDGGETGGGGPPFTPLGHRVVSRYDALDRRIREDLQVHGGGAHPASSAYRLQVLYLDFGRVALAEHGIESVRRALDVAGHGGGLPARDPRLREADGQLFGDLDGQDGSHVVERAARLSRRALMTALVLNANFGDDRECLPPRTPVDCGMLGILEGFRFFASFPDD